MARSQFEVKPVSRNEQAQAVGILAVIAFGATMIALGLQTYFGRVPRLVLLGQLLAAVAALQKHINEL